MKLNPTSALTGVCMGGLILGASSSAIAAEQVLLRYQGAQITISTRELTSFTETGILPDVLQGFLGADVPNAVQALLSREIRVPAFVDKFLGSSTGEFVLNQLDQSIGSPSGRTGKSLLSLKSAFSNAASDDRISVIELVDRYPQNTVRVDLGNLEGTYNRVANFVENVQPALEVAKGFLSDIICNCNNTASATPETSSQTYATTGAMYTNNSKPCNSADESNVVLDAAEEPLASPDQEPSEGMISQSAQ